MKKTILIFSIICLTFISSMPVQKVQADEIDILKQEIKDCGDEKGCREKLQNDAEKIFDAAGKKFSEDFAAIGHDITIKHCQSIAGEIFYHMDKIKSYHNFNNVFYYKKLKKLKENRSRFDNGEISNQDLTRISKQIDDQYNHDIKESQEFVNHKVRRMKELCRYFGDNVRELKNAERLTKSIMYLKNDRTWQAFESNSEEGQKIRKAVELSSDNAGKDLIICLNSMFNITTSPNQNKVFSSDVVKSLQKKSSSNSKTFIKTGSNCRTCP